MPGRVTHRNPTRRGLAALAAASVLLVGLTACTSTDGVATTANDANAGYTGTGSEFYAPGDRRAPADFRATAMTDGASVDTSALRGKVVVLNFWYATCPPCRTEAGLLDTVAGSYPSDRVVFVGVNTRDDVASAQAFERKFDVPYASVLDADTGDAQLAYAGVVPPNSTPATLVLDKRGRVAARILGGIESAAELGGYIDAALEEQ
ncbi:TlpA disulfide reductase family protein [Galbitalea sp. SE-J8]|uniref:TlpA family protein disulfide reductase n=1 Tax=Galbitalea sp. SE-J8 TaxID=3054952 RepID=UPI00259C6905|nr:TlpA disulfide reductase family protein [Galbitalea sp. SE-J8]MDM4762392.1 TlpA disulfide reductase family protein [Galbitalea sp. SE-J8]